MIRAKDGVRPRLPEMVMSLALGLILGEFGCTAVPGLRSVGTERPTLRGLWDRSRPPAPAPGDDYYAQTMHAARDPSAALAQRSDEARQRTVDGGEPAGGAT